MPTLAEQAAKLLEQDLAAEVNPHCRLCKLDGEQSQALELLLVSRRDTGRPTYVTMNKILRQLNIHTSTSSLNLHYRDHWHGKEKAAGKKSR